jgi:hypothetical protein
VAVRIDIEAFRESVPTPVGEAAARLLSNGSLGELEPAGGGVQAVVRDHDGVFQAWIGIVDGIFTGDCDCGMTGDDLCAHAVATALTAFDTGVALSGAATPPGADPVALEHAHYLEAVRRLSPRQLASLVAAHALRDRLFATRLLGDAGLLDADDHAGLDDARAAIRDAANVTTGSSWQISDIETAGHHLATEIEILCARPASTAVLDLVEQAVLVWDGLAAHLHDAHHITRTEPEEITEPLLDAHHDLCERLHLDPDDVAHRLTRLAERCHHTTIDIDTYTDLLGERADTIDLPRLG